VHLAELPSQELEVDVREEEGSGAMDVKLSSFQISPITNDDVLNVDVHNCAVGFGHSCTDQHLSPASDSHPDCNETDEKFIGADDVLIIGTVL